MSNMPCVEWDLKEIIDALASKHPEIDSLYLFGSRAYKTESLRSDVDLLAFTDGMLAPVNVNEWLHDAYPLVDLFTSCDGVNAVSVVNGSKVTYRKDGRNKDLVQQLDAIKLWNKAEGFSKDYNEWTIKTTNDAYFAMSIIPSYPNMNAENSIKAALSNLEKAGIKSYFDGSTWYEIAVSITEMIVQAMKKSTRFQRKARSFSFDTIKICNEYDFQNLILMILRPIYKDIANENFMIRIDGADKDADFGICNNQIVIEAKWIESVSKKAEVLKTLDGLKNFYSENHNVKCLIFVILYSNSVEIDEDMMKYRFSYERSDPKVIVRFIKNEYE